jgi:ribulose-phosphate 3-epimerase
MKIISAILAESLDEFVMRIHQAEKFADYVQVDIMDGFFVDTRSFDVEMINSIQTSLSFEVHLMVQEPINALMNIRTPSLKKAIFHVEAAGDPARFIEKARERGLSTGLAFKPETEIDDFRDIAVRCDTLLFLAVDPGRYGSPFRPEVLRKLSRARQEFPDKTICVDGGISFDNLKLLYDARVDCVCIGSRIFLHGNPEDNYRMFVGRIRELDATK